MNVACSDGNLVRVLELIRDSEAVAKMDSDYCLTIAVEGGHTEIVRALLALENVRPGADNNYAIKCACKYGHVEIVRALLAHPEVDPSDISDSECIDVIELLLEDGRAHLSDFLSDGRDEEILKEQIGQPLVPGDVCRDGTVRFCGKRLTLTFWDNEEAD